MSFVDLFDSYPASANITDDRPEIRTGWPLTASSVERLIASDGRNGGRALDLRNPSGVNVRYISRGVQGPRSGRTRIVRFGFAVKIEQSPSSFLFLNPATLPSQVASGSLLCELRVSAEQGANPVANVLQSTECYDVGDDLFNVGVLAPAGQQETVIESQSYAVPALSLYINSDGRLRVIKGRYGQSIAFGNPFFGNEEIIATSSIAVPLQQWAHIEVFVYMGSPESGDGFLYVWIDGEPAITVDSGINFVVRGIMASTRSAAYSPPFLPYPTSRNGCRVYRADTQGFYSIAIPADFTITGSPVLMDDFYLFTDIPATPGPPFGDLAVRELAVTGNGTPQDSVIGGTSPAATRWQSVETDDASVTLVRLEGAGDEDRYAAANLTGGEVVKAVRVVVRAKKTDAGAADLAMRVTTPAGTVEGTVVPVPSATDYSTIEQAWLTDPADAAWTTSAVDNAEPGMRRVR